MKLIRLFFAAMLTVFLMNDSVFAQDTTLTVTDAGDIGIGTTSPAAKLDVNGTMIVGTGEVFSVDSDGNVGVRKIFTDVALNVQANAEDTYILNLAKSDSVFVFCVQADGKVGIGNEVPDHPLHMASGAHVTGGGVWTDASSRQYKENITSLTEEEAISALDNLNPVRYNYKVQKDEEYVGFIAEDVPELVATGDRKSLSPMDIVAVLTKVVQQQQKKIAELEVRLNANQ